MGKPRPTPRRVDTALELVRKQRKLVASAEVGSPAHRQASDVLALIEESHFLLSEFDRMSMRLSRPVAGLPPRTTSLWPRKRRRLPLEHLAFAAALVAAAIFLEYADPAPVNIQASERVLQPAPP